MAHDAMIYAIDDDRSILYFISHVLQQNGYSVQNFSTGEKFLEGDISRNTGCVITDLWLPGISGVGIQEELLRRGHHVPLIAISSSPDVPTVVQMVKHGAMTVLQKPLSVDQLLSTVEEAIHQNQIRREKDVQRDAVRDRLSLLTERETKVLKCLMNGMPHKTISSTLDLSPRTVDRHKKSILEKMKSPTLQQLILAIAEANSDLDDADAIAAG